jgi:hypothetical protein
VIVANLANVGVGNVMADFAMFYFAAKLNDAVSKIVYSLNILPEYVQYKPESAFSSDSGKFGEFVYSSFEQF